MDSELLARYLAGEASAADTAAVEAWAASVPANRAELDRLRAVWSLTPAPAAWDTDAAWARLARRLDRPAAPDETLIIPARRPVVRWLAAAAVLVAAGTGTWFIRRTPAATAFETKIGEQRSITLADGSRIVLAPASTLEVDGAFGTTSRSLKLTGQAWFEVRHDAAKPFRIQVGGVTVEDLGTEFEIEAHSETIRIAVAQGAVAVHSAGSRSLTLAAGDLATVPNSGEGVVDHQAPVERITSWRQGTLAFEDRPLSEVAAELEHWYDVSFRLAAGVGTRRLHVTVPTGNLDEALLTIATALDLQHSRAGRTVTIAPKGVP